MIRFFERLLSRTSVNPIARWWWQVDRTLLALFCVLFVAGLILIGAAGPAVAVRVGLDSAHFMTRHSMFAVVAVFAMFLASFMSEAVIRRGATLLYIGAVLGCLLALFYGADVKGARRWFYIGPFSVQPSEFLKPALFILSAWLLSRPRDVVRHWGLVSAVGLWGLSVALLLMQPDLGMTIVTTVIWGAQMVVAGLPFLIVIPLLVLGVLALFLVYLTFPHVTSRIDRFFNSDAGDTYQIDKSLQAFANGGWFGEGPGQGDVIKYLPDAHADFIFSVAAEEMGFLAIVAIVWIYVMIVSRSLGALHNSKNLFIILAVCGLVGQIGLQAIIHMGSSIDLLPTKGMTLPFLSYGGSSLVSMGLIAGVLLALTRRDVVGSATAYQYRAEPAVPKRQEIKDVQDG